MGRRGEEKLSRTAVAKAGREARPSIRKHPWARSRYRSGVDPYSGSVDMTAYEHLATWQNIRELFNRDA